MSLNDRDWYREAIRERDSKNKKEMHSEISKSPSNDINIKQTKKYDELVVAGIVIYAALVYVLRMFVEYPGCAAIIALNILAFVIIKCGKLEKSALGSSYHTIVRCKENYRIFTSSFTHFEPIHLLCNLGSLYNLGPYMEKLLGTTLFIIFYTLIMIVGGYISVLLHKKKPYTQSIGASGVICGILGIYLAIAFILMGFGGIKSMMPTIAILLLMTFSPRIDSIGHFTGLATGILCGIAVIYFF